MPKSTTCSSRRAATAPAAGSADRESDVERHLGSHHAVAEQERDPQVEELAELVAVRARA